MDVSVIIVNYNTEGYIKNCLDSIRKLVIDVLYEIIIVDNKSDDCSFLKELQYNNPDIKVIYLDKNVGFGAANNVGVKVAAGEKILLLNPDTILVNNAVKILFDRISSDSNIGVCGGNLYDEFFNATFSYAQFMPGILFEINRVFANLINILIYGKNRNFNHTNNILDVAYVSGADMMIDKCLFEKTAGFDEDFFMYYEETELTHRIKKMGYRIISEPNAKIIHLEGKSFKHSCTRCKFILISWHKYLKKQYKNRFIRILCNVIFTIANVNMLVFSYLLKKRELCKSLKYTILNTFKINSSSKYEL